MAPVAHVVAVARAHPVLAVFTSGYLVGLTIYGLAVGADLAIPYLVIVLALMVAVAALDARVGLGPAVLWLLAAWGAAHIAGGVVPLDGDRTLYNAWLLPAHALRYDQVVHFFGFGTATFVCGLALARWLPPGPIGIGPAAIVLLAGMGVGAINEIVEFVATLVIPDTNVGGYTNTGWDLVADLAGAIVATVLLVILSRRSPASLASRLRAAP